MELQNNGRKGAKKIIVLLTDGSPTEYAWSPASGTVGRYSCCTSTSGAQSQAECAANEAKALGFTIVTVGVNINSYSISTKKNLEALASAPTADHYVEVSDIGAKLKITELVAKACPPPPTGDCEYYWGKFSDCDRQTNLQTRSPVITKQQEPGEGVS